MRSNVRLTIKGYGVRGTFLGGKSCQIRMLEGLKSTSNQDMLPKFIIKNKNKLVGCGLTSH